MPKVLVCIAFCTIPELLPRRIFHLVV